MIKNNKPVHERMFNFVVESVFNKSCHIRALIALSLEIYVPQKMREPFHLFVSVDASHFLSRSCQRAYASLSMLQNHNEDNDNPSGNSVYDIQTMSIAA